MTRQYIQSVKLSFFSLLQKELTDRLPATESISYYDFSADAPATKDVELPAMANFYRHPTSVEAEFPYICLLSENLKLSGSTQQGQDEIPHFAIQLWDCDFEQETLEDRISAYAAMISRILAERKEKFIEVTKVIDIVDVDQILLPAIKDDEYGIIRAVFIPIQVQQIEV